MLRLPRFALLLAAATLVFALDSTSSAQGDGAPNHKALDKQIHGTVANVINQGADLFNLQGDVAGCYRIYQGALLTLRPLLGHHADLQKSIDEALSRSDRIARMTDRAFALRKVLGQIHQKLDPDPKTVKSLWDRLGGEANIMRVIDDFVMMAAEDPKVDFTRGGKFKVDEAGVKRLKKLLLELVSQETGGPYKYTGKNLKEAHENMAITDAEFNATAGHLKHALEKHKAQPADIDQVLKALGKTRKDIVEPAKKKGEEKTNGEELAKIYGLVSFKGQPLSTGFVSFVGSDGRQFSASILKDGTYVFKKGLPVGTYKVLYENSVVPAFDQNGQPIKTPPDPGPPIPARYLNVDTTPLRVELRDGKNVIKLELK